MGQCAQGLHHLARFCPSRCQPFLTFLDHGLVQEAHSWLIHGLRTEVVVRALVDLASCRFPSPCCPCPVCSAQRAPLSPEAATGGIRRGSAPFVEIPSADLGPGYPTML